MKFLLIFGLTLISLFPADIAYAAEENPNMLQIDFYPNGAKFTFECQTDKDGNFELVLPSSFRDITDWRTALVWHTVPVSRPGWIPPSLRELDSEIKDNKNKMDLLDARINSLAQTLTLLGNVRHKGENPGDFINYVKEAQSISENTAVEIAKLKTERENLMIKFNVLTEEFQSKLPYNSDKAVKITGRSDKGSPVKIEAFTDAAGWTPEYILKLDSETGRIDAELYANVNQKTGLDAVNIPLTFHTNNPLHSAAVPELPPITADIGRPAPRAAYLNKSVAEYGLSAPMQEDSAAVQSAMAMRSGPVSVSTGAEGSVKGDGAADKISLGNHSTGSKISLISVPGYGNSVYLVADTEPLKQPLIESGAKLYVDGKESSNTYLKNFGEGEEAEITFGTAPLVSVKKKNIVSKSDSSWLGSSGYLNDGYTIEVTNGMASERTVTVKDRIPVSANTKVKIKDIKYAPEPSEKTEDNILTWNINLKPGEKSEISVQYTIEFPSGESLMFEELNINR